MGATHIYGIRDLKTDKFIYVGKSNELKSRYSRLNHSHNDCVREFIEEKGEDNFQVEPLETIQFKTSEEWIEHEKFWIAKFRKEGHPLCNKNVGGGGPTEMSEEAKASISKALTGREVTEETKAKIRKARLGKSSGMLGKHHTEETKAKMSKAGLGKPGGMLGKHHAEETKAKIGKVHKGKKISEEHKIVLRRSAAKSYPAFFNINAGEHIPAGVDLLAMCREQDLNYQALSNLRIGRTKQSRDGWRLATENEVLGAAVCNLLATK